VATRLALFDIGRTLVRGDPALLFAAHLRESGRFQPEAWRRMEEALADYRAGRDPDRAVEAANAAFAAAFAGMAPAELEAWAREGVRDALAAHYYPYARPLLALFRARGYRTVAVTGVADPLASLLGHDLGADETFATRLEVAEGRLTGATRFEGGEGWKRRRVEALLERSDPATAFAFGDSAADLPLLARVGHPVVLNPQPAFEARVRAMGWPVLHEGEDVEAFVRAAFGRPPWNEAAAAAGG
jgi:HAD superfamily hydrolase (TIGR01490 family)